jgi:hypothetical protein
MPYPTQIHLEPGQLTVSRQVEESGFLLAPWTIEGLGRLMGSSATLIERSQPYYLQLELARGKVNQVRSQASDWLMGGLQMSGALAEQIRAATLAFSKAVTSLPSDEVDSLSQTALTLGYQAAEQLVQAYIEQVFQVRHQRQAQLDTSLGCRLGSTVPGREATAALRAAFNTVCLPFAWSEIEPAEGVHRWEPQDALLDWAEEQQFTVVGGPLIDFSAARLPDWLWLWERDLASIASFLCDQVELVVKRYHNRIRTWQLTAASNSAAVLNLAEDELLWLTVRLAEAARQVEPNLELLVGIAQPWGEYLALEDRTHSPFVFADTLIRSGLNLAALDLEIIMGVAPRGSYCRDLLEVSRLIDLYTLLGVPLQVTLAYPAASTLDERADPELDVGAGYWRQGFRPEGQADWTSTFAALALCKPSVRSVQWAHFADTDPHQFPHCGLADGEGTLRPALQCLRELREQHLH